MFVRKKHILFLIMLTMSLVSVRSLAYYDIEEEDTETIEVWGEPIGDGDDMDIEDILDELDMEEYEIENEDELEEAIRYSQCLLDVNRDNVNCVSETISQANSDRNTCQAGAVLTGGLAALWNNLVGLGIGVGLAYECSEAADFIIDNAQSYCDAKIESEREDC